VEKVDGPCSGDLWTPQLGRYSKCQNDWDIYAIGWLSDYNSGRGALNKSYIGGNAVTAWMPLPPCYHRPESQREA
jgi:hypothetical protein